ncbi:MAG: alpha-N-acetylglucosaminidase C-terminal domain-containing protein [Verrucomicrobia bacterium]|nr:alpha-N-acetylglucosaminidase C-terminal domain-containing protein [Verrucomicrobiota bacterium]
MVAGESLMLAAQLCSRVSTAVSALAFLLVLFPNHVVAGGGKPLLLDKETEVVLYTRPQASPPERYAAEEFARYLGQITGARIALAKPPLPNVADGKTAILIGAFCHDDFSRLAAGCGVALPAPEIVANPDAFLVSVGERLICLAGGSGRATLYAVYDFLEQECQAGFFRIAEQVPKTNRLSLAAHDRVRKPRFPFRMYSTDSGTPVHYSNWANTKEDWRWNVDYRIKKKLNPFLAPYGLYPLDEVMAELGVDVKWTDTPAREMADTIVGQLRRCGGTLVVQLSEGSVDPKFVEKYPQARYIKSTWVGSYEGRYLHPDDPLFERYVSLFVRQFLKCAAGVEVFTFAPYQEKVFGASQAERRQIVTALARRMGEILLREAPQARVSFDSWAFHNREYWDPDTVAAFFKAIPSQAKLLIIDFASNTSPFYRETNYFWGQDWLYGWYYQDGPGNFMHGDMTGFITDVQQISATEGCRCAGIFMLPEVTDSNEVMVELGARLAWNPDLTRQAFLDSYVLRRYGQASFKRMRAAWELLADSVYSRLGSRSPCELHGRTWAPYYTAEPKYHFTLGTRDIGGRTIDFAGYVEEMEKRLPVLSALQQSLRLALREQERQRDSRLYQQDLFECLRQLLVDLFNQNLMRAEMAYASGDTRGFERFVKATGWCLEAQVRLHEAVRSWPEFAFAALLAKGQNSAYRTRTFDDVVRWMAGLKDGKIEKTMSDYWRMDRFESLKYYYQPRVQAYLEFLKREMGKGNRVLPSPEKPDSLSIRDSFYFGNSIGYPSWELKGDLAELYANIGLRFARQQGWQLELVSELYADNPVPAIVKILAELEDRGIVAIATEMAMVARYQHEAPPAVDTAK